MERRRPARRSTQGHHSIRVRFTRNLPVVAFVVFLLVCVAADGDDADGRAGRVGDDDGLPGDVVLVLVLVLGVAGGAAGLLGFTGPPTAAATAAALRGLAVGSRAVLEHRAARGRVLLHPLGALRRRHHLG